MKKLKTYIELVYVQKEIDGISKAVKDVGCTQISEQAVLI